jgi:hypothetical protein
MIDQPGRRTDRSLHEKPSTVRAVPVEMTIGAPGAERTFETADPSVDTLGRQIGVAAFTIRSKLEHDHLLEQRFATGGSENPSIAHRDNEGGAQPCDPWHEPNDIGQSCRSAWLPEGATWRCGS